MNADCWIAVGQILTGAGTVVLSATAFTAVCDYRRRVRLEKLQWLHQLYQGFYDSDLYKSVRQEIDFVGFTKLGPLLRRSEAEPEHLRPEERLQIDQFTDYLNFFEWIGVLESEGELTFKDVDAMFNYYLKRLLQVDQNQEIRRYIRNKGFERLHSLLNKYSRVDKA